MIDSALRLDSSGFGSISMAIAPFYAILISVALTVIYFKYEMALDKASEVLSKFNQNFNGPNKKHDIYSELNKIKELKDKEILSEEEYNKQKEILLKKIEDSSDNSNN
jgi:hypothetical protein